MRKCYEAYAKPWQDGCDASDFGRLTNGAVNAGRSDDLTEARITATALSNAWEPWGADKDLAGLALRLQ
jgi:hypothetical protein